MSEITYVKGDATDPQADGEKFIVHCCNDIGLWGSGFVVALSDKWREPEAAFREGRFTEENLGGIQFIKVEPDITVVNLIGQHGVRRDNNPRPVRYDAIHDGLSRLQSTFDGLEIAATVHMPRMGAGLAGGNWRIISTIIEETITVPVFVYDLPPHPLQDLRGT